MSFLTSSGHPAHDFDLESLREFAGVLDRRLEELDRRAAALRAEDPTYPDSFGIFGSQDYVVGVGLVACQAYIVATYRQLGFTKAQKQAAMAAEPMHRSGYSIAQLVNHAANYWKHSGEWDDDDESDNDAARMRVVFKALGLEEYNYPLLGVLDAIVLSKKARVSRLISHLEAWRDGLAEAR